MYFPSFDGLVRGVPTRLLTSKTLAPGSCSSSSKNNLTTLMITHNMRDAIKHGNRLIMMNEGRIIVDVSGEDKKNLTVEDLLDLFTRASGKEFANDRTMLA